MRGTDVTLVGVVLLGIQVACAPAPQPATIDPSDATTSESGSTRRRGSRASNVLPAREIRASTHGDVFEMIQALRPNWLTQRGISSFSDTEPGVYLDGVEMQGMAILRTIAPSQIERAEYLTASEATFQVGTQRGVGAILLFSRKGGR